MCKLYIYVSYTYVRVYLWAVNLISILYHYLYVCPWFCWVRSTQNSLDAERRLAHALSIRILPAR